MGLPGVLQHRQPRRAPRVPRLRRGQARTVPYLGLQGGQLSLPELEHQDHLPQVSGVAA
jgi:hypothetical protein